MSHGSRKDQLTISLIPNLTSLPRDACLAIDEAIQKLPSDIREMVRALAREMRKHKTKCFQFFTLYAQQLIDPYGVVLNIFRMNGLRLEAPELCTTGVTGPFRVFLDRDEEKESPPKRRRGEPVVIDESSDDDDSTSATISTSASSSSSSSAVARHRRTTITGSHYGHLQPDHRSLLCAVLDMDGVTDLDRLKNVAQIMRQYDIRGFTFCKAVKFEGVTPNDFEAEGVERVVIGDITHIRLRQPRSPVNTLPHPLSDTTFSMRAGEYAQHRSPPRMSLSYYPFTTGEWSRPATFPSSTSSSTSSTRIELQRKLEAQIKELPMDSSSADDSTKLGKCAVCSTNPPCALVRSCNHYCLCRSCASLLVEDWSKKITQAHPQCPMCRQPIESLERLFFT